MIRRIKITSFLFSIGMCVHPLYATIHRVGAGKTHPTPHALYLSNAVDTGDTIAIDAGIYSGQDALAVWQADRLIIQGVGGRVQLFADGRYILGKGIWVLAGDEISVEHIDFFQAAVPDKNGAGIRLDGTSLTVRHCGFFGNENGILTGNPHSGTVVIEYCEFDNGGFGDGYSHNLYIGHIDRLIFRYNYSHHARIGHNLKSRAKENYILFNRIMDEESGSSSRLVDLSNGGRAIIMGNLFMQGPAAPNRNMIGFGLEGLTDALDSELYFVHNSLVNKRLPSCLFVDVKSGSKKVLLVNNIFAGTGTLYAGPEAEIHHNLTLSDIDEVRFVDEAGYDYKLTADSPARDAGTVLDSVLGFSLSPMYEYEHPLHHKERPMDQTPDAGAHEYQAPSLTPDQESMDIKIYPNPATAEIYLTVEGEQPTNAMVFDRSGVIVYRGHGNRVDVSNWQSGIYTVLLFFKNAARKTLCFSKI